MVDEIERLLAASRRHEVEVAGTTSVWRAWGEGQPVVLVHGAGGSWTHWVRNIEALAEDRFVLAPDLPGFGESASPADLRSLSVLVDALVTGIERLTPHHAVVPVVGFSFGGIVATGAARSLGDRVERLVLIGAGGIGMPARVPDPLPARSGEHDPDRLDLARFMLASLDSADDLALAVHRSNVAGARFRTGTLPASTALVEALADVHVPLHAIYSDRDAFSGDQWSEPFDRLQVIRPDVDCHVVAGAGHWSIYEAADEVNRILRSILVE